MEDAAAPPRGRPEVRPAVMTGLLAAGQAMTVALIIAIGSLDGSAPSPVVYLFALAFGLVLIARERVPVLVLVASVMLVFVYYALGFPAIGVALPVVAAFYAAVERGRVVVPIVAAAVLLTVSLFFRVADGVTPVVLAYDVLTNAALLGAAIALAIAVRSRRALRAGQDALVAGARERERERARLRLEEQRTALARDLHDALGHELVVLSVQAQVARQSLDRDPGTTADALGHVASAAERSLTRLRGAVDRLRDDGSAVAGPPTVAALADAARSAGIEVELDETPVPGMLDAVVRAVVREAVTNVIRHARSRRVAIRVARNAEGVLVVVEDDGGGAPELIEGNGIRGMRERVEAVGGRLDVASGPPGLRIVARIPVGGS